MKNKSLLYGLILISSFLLNQCKTENPNIRIIEKFTKDWKFYLGDIDDAQSLNFDDNDWRILDLPHDWSIEGEFSNDHPATPGGGALPGGIAWYRKSFSINKSDSGKMVFIDFDGIYMNSEVWINEQYLGKRPSGYISFRYDLTPYLKFGDQTNILAVKVDNSQQPNSRWYSGSGIYRNVWLIKTNKTYIDHWGTFITTPDISEESAKVVIQTNVVINEETIPPVELKTIIYNKSDKKIGETSSIIDLSIEDVNTIQQEIKITKPELWTVDNPNLYKAITYIKSNKEIIDNYETEFGIRYFEFDSLKGFSLNGKPMKILGVCNHHDLGCLGTAINTRALERQLEILKEMGCNSIRTAHNPPAPELLDLCDKMGLLVMDEMFDMWKKNKSPYDYSMYWDEWHKQDLKDFILRDRNHPSVIIWSIGNEILEQWGPDTSGIQMIKDLYESTHNLDPSRPIITANNPPFPDNNLNKPMVIDLIGYNYAHAKYEEHSKVFSGIPFIATETTSSLASRGEYNMPSDSIRRWPYRWDVPFTDGNPDNTCSSYDNSSTPWGSTHEEVWKIIKKHDNLSGLYIWTGFDYLGEPTPYSWPSRSSYFGIVDLAGFPKDAYYMYQSEWTNKDVLHVFPHWNWQDGDTIDVWVYTNYNQVELFLNNESLGIKEKQGDDIHLMWRVNYMPGTIKAIAKRDGKENLDKEIKTAEEPTSLYLNADRNTIKANGEDLSFITVDVMDKNGTLVPKADNLVEFTVDGPATIVGVDNGNQTSHEPFKANERKAFNGKCLLVIQSTEETGEIKIMAKSEGLEISTISVYSR
ncbi:beta-galactosidase GalB [Bacteroidota bacterium]